MAIISNKNQFTTKRLLVVISIALLIGAYFVYKSFAAATTMSVIPATSTPKSLGANFTVDVRVNSDTETINAVRASLTFPTDKLQFVSIDATTSAFSIEAISTGSNSTGTVRLERAAGPGVNGDQLIAKVTFKAIATGSAAINVDATSLALRSSDNTNVLTIRNAANYTIADTTAPSVPTGVTVGTRGITSIPLTWTASTDNVAVTGYRVYRNGGATPVGSPTTTSFTDNGLTVNTSYTYTVSAVDAAGNESVKSTVLSTSTLADTTAPTVPTALKLTGQTLSSVTFSWTASTDATGVAGYRIYRNNSTTPIGTSPTTSFTDSSGLVLNSTYNYTVSAYDAAGNESAKSSPALSVQIVKPGDINRDSQVDLYDLSIMLSNYGKTVAGGGLAGADLNGNGTIDGTDLSILLTNYGS